MTSENQKHEERLTDAIARAPNTATVIATTRELARAYPHHGPQFLETRARDLVVRGVVDALDGDGGLVVRNAVGFARAMTELASMAPRHDANADGAARALAVERWLERQGATGAPVSPTDARAELDALAPLPDTASEDERIQRSMRREALLRQAHGIVSDPTQGGI